MLKWFPKREIREFEDFYRDKMFELKIKMLGRAFDGPNVFLFFFLYSNYAYYCLNNVQNKNKCVLNPTSM